LLRPRYIKKKHKLLSVEDDFPVGSQIPIHVDDVDLYTNLINANIAWELTQYSSPRIPKAGDIESGVVIWTSPYGAHCLLDNRVIGFMHKSTVIGKIPEHLSKHIHPGDQVEVKVTGQSDERRGTYIIEFLRRIEQYDENETEESTLLDLDASRRTGVIGGFTRDPSFRWSVLEAYDHCCGVCGSRYVVRGTSAMEAAHVVPRGKRGADLLQNALCLCPIHHWAFDKGYLTVDDEYAIRIASVILASGDEGNWLANFHGQSAHISDDSPVSRKALDWHRRNIFLDR
jgi:predicted RNA-binding protein with RPS1 domain